MLAELPAAYAALAAGRVPELPALETSYVDFAFWQRARLEDDGALAPQACPGWSFLPIWRQFQGG